MKKHLIALTAATAMSIFLTACSGEDTSENETLQSVEEVIEKVAEELVVEVSETVVTEVEEVVETAIEEIEESGVTTDSTATEAPEATAPDTASDAPEPTADITSTELPESSATDTASDAPEPTADITSTELPESSAPDTASEVPEPTAELTAPGNLVGKSFSGEYLLEGITSSGKPKNDTFIFKGTTDANGIISTLEMDIIRNKDTEDEYSKKDIMGYLMNISDILITSTDNGLKLNTTSYGYNSEYAPGSSSQFMVSASIDNLTPETTFGELTFLNDAAAYTSPEPVPVPIDKALIAFAPLAKEAGIEELNEDTLVVDIISAHGLYKDGQISEGSTRISFEGVSGGRSYGEQIDAIVSHILANKMTLEDVHTMFQTENQAHHPIEERDAISGATITFVGDFVNMVYVTMHGKLPVGVIETYEDGDNTIFQVITYGYGGAIKSEVTLDKEKTLVDFRVLSSIETPRIGAVLTEDNSAFINDLIAGDGTADAVSGATSTSRALMNAVKYAKEYLE
ncbi:hypothetical protein AN640_00665 [Candidatus Epulonipiscium fishelsonii]|uniref:Uncharacterized protein n=1 Tax=Candidatus Epulonipiscium fishelsonii TaxID=77094 RepID=A0ACC8XJT5_9FIRM|nr:hypothetical protein AN640_00665 [Epulopiscium sp. SCG-D08WGA-EpuloA1]